MPCYAPLKGFRDPETGGLTFKRHESSGIQMDVACGQCLGCRLDNARMWSMRIVHESRLHEFDQGNCFITLTYEDPGDWSLHVKHFQDFMKRLRKSRPHKVRFFHCGEYGAFCRHGSVEDCFGCNVGRPHYHAILFNCTFSDLEVCGRDGETTYYTSAELSKIWKHGFVQVGDVTLESAGYVARYCVKKVNGDRAIDHYVVMDDEGVLQPVEPEYATMSRRPGIGKAWFDKYKEDLFPMDEVPVPGSGVYKKVPRYYADLYGRLDPDGLESVKERRRLFREEHRDEYSDDRLRDKYAVKKAQVNFLKRIL